MRRLATLLLLAPAAAAADTFRYDGWLTDGAQAAQGRYDLQLRVFPAEKAGAALAQALEFPAVEVREGRFEVAFELLDGSPPEAWVELSVRGPGSTGFSRIAQRTKAVAAPTIGQCWSATGDTLTNPNFNFLGTIDLQPLVLRTANARSLRLDPANIFTGGLPITHNVLGGSHANSIVAGRRGVTISGGGTPMGDPDPNVPGEGPQVASGSYATIGGGAGNAAGGEFAHFATVGGGSTNQASGFAATIGGGFGNLASGNAATIAGGNGNTAEGNQATVAGGVSNIASGFQPVVGGGTNNIASGSAATVPGGVGNCAGGAFSFAAGAGAIVRAGSGSGASCGAIPAVGTFGDSGTFLWADRGTAGGIETIVSAGSNQFLARSRGGVVFQDVIAGETDTRRPRGYFNAVAGDSGIAQPASPSANTVASFESDTDAFIRVLTPDAEERGIAFGEPGGGLSDGAIVYSPANTLQFRTNGNVTRMTLGADGTLTLNTLGAAGSTAVCRNASSQLSTCSSSARYKRDIQDLPLGLDAVLRLRPVSYVWKEGGMADVGFVAEEVARIDERLVTRNAQGQVEGVKYERLSALLAGAAQQLAAQASLQQQAIERLEGDSHALREELRALRADLEALRHGRH